MVGWIIICSWYDQLVSGEAKPARERWFGAFRELITLNRFQRGYTEDDQILVAAMRHTDKSLVIDLTADTSDTAPTANDNSVVKQTLDLDNVCM